MPAIVIKQKAAVVVNAGVVRRQPIIVREQPVEAVITSPAHIGVDAHEKRVVVVRVGEPGPVGPKGEDSGPSNIAMMFTQSALPGPIAIGGAIANRKVLSVIVEVEEGFDAGVGMTVGTMVSQGILLTESENCLQVIGMYEKTANYEYEGTPTFQAFFSGGGPFVAGRAKVTISFT
ncbi:MAG: hypothetical protein KKD63_16845 [Proteobacteria bacterium]|nr:hypothetical protein [Desulfobulbaceae bacterium]MBU4154540.1 hypothetical protein [Pseudomonadota bacterium]